MGIFSDKVAIKEYEHFCSEIDYLRSRIRALENLYRSMEICLTWHSEEIRKLTGRPDFVEKMNEKSTL